jgi:hypothetical protein
MTTTTRTETAGPTYVAYHVSELRPGKKRWNRIGAFFAHEDGQGGSLILDALPIAFDGRIVLRTPKPDSQSGDGAQ